MDDRLTFRIPLGPPLLLALAPLAVLAGIGLIVAALSGSLAAAVAVLLFLAVVSVLFLALIGLVVRVSRWHVDPDGIGGRNNSLVYHRLAWADIESVSPFLIPGYRYLQVNGRGRRWAFWLPLFLTDMPALRAAVSRYAPPDNPLRVYLER